MSDLSKELVWMAFTMSWSDARLGVVLKKSLKTLRLSIDWIFKLIISCYLSDIQIDIAKVRIKWIECLENPHIGENNNILT